MPTVAEALAVMAMGAVATVVVARVGEAEVEAGMVAAVERQAQGRRRGWQCWRWRRWWWRWRWR